MYRKYRNQWRVPQSVESSNGLGENGSTSMFNKIVCSYVMYTHCISSCFPYFSIAADKHGKVQLSFNGDRFAQLGVNGSFLPLMMEFQTQLPNVLLLYTQSDTAEVLPVVENVQT